MRVELSTQVVDFVRRPPPDPRKRLRRALRELAREKGDIKRLEGPLEGYCRLRVDGFRVILSYTGRGAVQCVFAERRGIIYEVFALALRATLLGGKKLRERRGSWNESSAPSRRHRLGHRD
jgi:mRNA-degrading endonuclease RelE of RelBE toxin-antitoxin system